jgi:histidyl-tRNA synthetase
MSGTIQSIRGMNDVLPGDSGAWQLLESVARETFAEYGYREIRLPLLERTELFKRSIGEMTDIVEKEMYTFEDRGGESVTLRPEATAGIVRACMTNGLLHNQRQKVWCAGPMFRYERPQKGRYRQFHQIDVEALGFPGPDVDAELILMSARIWRKLGLRGLTLNLNSLGTPQSRRVYREKLVEYFRGHAAQLDDDSRRRLDGNPLRILDSKNPAMRDVNAGAPLITDHLDAESAAHFSRLRSDLEAAGIAYVVNPRLVRGLDYYSRTVFEWVTSDLGSQDAVCSGGRYDGLVAQLGGDEVPAIGWALGEERIVELLRLQQLAGGEAAADVYVVLGSEPAEAAGLRIAESLRDALPGTRIEMNCGAGSFKSQLKRADRSGARYAVILGEEELARGVAGLKALREEAGQSAVPLADLAGELSRLVAGRGRG